MVLNVNTADTEQCFITTLTTLNSVARDNNILPAQYQGEVMKKAQHNWVKSILSAE